MDKTVLSIEDLTVESFTTESVNAEFGAGIIDTGCVSNCASGCGGFGFC